MPGGVSLVPDPGQLVEFVTGLVGAIYVTGAPELLDAGVGGAILVEGVWFSCPTSSTAAMMTVAAEAKRAGEVVVLRYFPENNLISDIGCPVITFLTPF
jgi:hypothetical protein